MSYFFSYDCKLFFKKITCEFLRQETCKDQGQPLTGQLSPEYPSGQVRRTFPRPNHRKN
jgi:hypothetical protein